MVLRTGGLCFFAFRFVDWILEAEGILRRVKIERILSFMVRLVGSFKKGWEDESVYVKNFGCR